MTKINAWLYCVASSEITDISASQRDPRSIEFADLDGISTSPRAIKVVIETDMSYCLDTITFLRDNIKLVDEIPMAPNCEITVLEDSARKDSDNANK